MSTHKFLIDGYNLAHKLGLRVSREQLENVRGQVEQKVSGFLAVTKAEAVLVYDGRGMMGSGSQSGRLKILYTRSGETADSVIKTLIDSEPARSRLRVVSSDHEVSGYARVSGVQHVRSEDFLKEMLLSAASRTGVAAPRGGPAEKPGAPISASELDAWKKLFGA